MIILRFHLTLLTRRNIGRFFDCCLLFYFLIKCITCQTYAILFWQLCDNILKTIEISPDPELKESRELILRIKRRELYQVLVCPCIWIPSTKCSFLINFLDHDIRCHIKWEIYSIKYFYMYLFILAVLQWICCSQEQARPF